MKTIEIYAHKDEANHLGVIYTEDRYIIVDEDGIDAVGAHFSLEKAENYIAEEIDQEISEASKECSHKYYWHLNALFPGDTKKQKEVEDFIKSGQSKKYTFGPVDFRGQIYYAVSRKY